MKRFAFPFQKVGMSNQLTTTKSGCGCHDTTYPNTNGTLEDILANITSGQPLAVIDIGIANETLLKMGLGVLTLMFINKEINKK